MLFLKMHARVSDGASWDHFWTDFREVSMRVLVNSGKTQKRHDGPTKHTTADFLDERSLRSR